MSVDNAALLLSLILLLRCHCLLFSHIHLRFHRGDLYVVQKVVSVISGWHCHLASLKLSSAYSIMRKAPDLCKNSTMFGYKIRRRNPLKIRLCYLDTHTHTHTRTAPCPTLSCSISKCYGRLPLNCISEHICGNHYPLTLHQSFPAVT